MELDGKGTSKANLIKYRIARMLFLMEPIKKNKNWKFKKH